ncbi:putative reverse transcriptase domain-containing protein [Tanacetum coccineum]|uniref:Reverse transcriptase domain-containing protein n=1 Tax=Tanacetum coccineum TaxID=301880 RepID=A0ABQ5EKP6_9ASTR
MCGPVPSIFLRNPIIVEGSSSNLKIPCNIGHVHIKKAYIDLNSPLNIMTRMMYNWIMRRKLSHRENANGGISNFTGRIKGMHVFIRNFTYVINFLIVEDISSIIDPRLSQVALGRPFVEMYNMTHDPPEGVVRFTKETDKVVYKMPHKIEQYESLSDLEKWFLEGPSLMKLALSIMKRKEQSFSKKSYDDRITKEQKQEEIIVVKDFPEVFPDDLSRLPPVWEIEFRIELVPGAMPVAKSSLSFEVQFLGHMINGDGIHVEPSKIEAVKNWRAPRTPSEVRSFLDWQGITVALPDGPEDFVVYYDALGLGLGCVLMQRGKVIAYASSIAGYRFLVIVTVRFATTLLSIKDMILAAQKEASDESAGLQKGLDEMIKLRSDGAMYYLDRIWVPLKGDVRTLIMDEAHKSKYSIYPRADKMYYDLRDRYWWPGIKKDIVVYVSRCLTCLKVKAEHQRPSGLLQQPEIHEWKWEGIAIDFVTKLPRTSSGYDTIWVIVDQLTKSSHFLPMREDYKMDRFGNQCKSIRNPLVTVRRLITHQPDIQSEQTIRPLEDLIRAVRPRTLGEVRNGSSSLLSFVNNSYHSSVRCARLGSIKDRLKVARDRQKSCVDKGRKPLDFSVGDYVLLRSGRLRKVCPVAYRLDFPEELNGVHDTFHVSNSKKCLADPILQVPLNEIRVDAKLNFMEEPVEILEREFKKLKHSRIAIVKVHGIQNVGLNSRGNVKIR